MTLNEARLHYMKQMQTNFDFDTPDWHEFRSHQFGGSEVSSVIGQNPFESAKQMISKKINRTKTNNISCHFGRLFEIVAKKYLTTLKKVKLHEFNSIKSCKYPVSYSPDGVIEYDETLSLIEIKCPFRRYKLGEVPDYYLPQIKSGMAILPVDNGEFHQFRFRVCSIFNLGENEKYNRWFHYEGSKRVPGIEPLCWGYIRFTDSGDFKDIGAMGPKQQDEFMECTCDYVTVDNVYLQCDQYQIAKVGKVLGFKLLDHTIHRFDKDNSYLDNLDKNLWYNYMDLVSNSNHGRVAKIT